MIPVNTQNILFICSGAFEGIGKIIEKRLNTRPLGFKSSDKGVELDKNNFLQYISPADVRTYGLIPELIGRMPIITHLDPLTKDALKRILTEPKNAILRQYEALLLSENVKLIYHDDVVDYLAEKAIELKLGARGLRGMIEQVMLDIMFYLPSQNLQKENIDQIDEYVLEVDEIKFKVEAYMPTRLKAVG
jgi:ATP-dependent Clp protease ATP-binding subunit ClpX